MTGGDDLYRRAAALSQQGDKAGAARLLRQSAEMDHGDSLYTLATMLIDGVAGTVDRAEAFSLLARAADAGHPQATYTAALFEARGIGREEADWQGAIRRLTSAARNGDRCTLRQLGILALMTEGGLDHGAVLLHHAAAAGDAIAMLALARLAEDAQSALPIGRGAAAWLAMTALRAKHPAAQELVHRLKGVAPERPPRPQSAPSFAWIATGLRSPPIPACPTPETISERPRVKRFERFLTGIECDYVMALAGPLLHPAQIMDPRTGKTRPDPYRRSLTAVFHPLDQDLVLHVLDLRIAAAADIPASHGEMLSVLAYGKGHEYKPHFDLLPEDAGAGDAERRRSGQRIATFLITLNDGFAGGETSFPEAGLSIRMTRGGAILFYNVDETGAPECSALHAGRPVTDGVKWMASKWLRERPYLW